LFGGGAQQIQLRTEGREFGDLEAVAPPPVRGSAQFAIWLDFVKLSGRTDVFSTEFGIRLSFVKTGYNMCFHSDYGLVDRLSFRETTPITSLQIPLIIFKFQIIFYKFHFKFCPSLALPSILSLLQIFSIVNEFCFVE
jgi:hypothetical protein